MSESIKELVVIGVLARKIKQSQCKVLFFATVMSTFKKKSHYYNNKNKMTRNKD